MQNIGTISKLQPFIGGIASPGLMYRPQALTMPSYALNHLTPATGQSAAAVQAQPTQAQPASGALNSSLLKKALEAANQLTSTQQPDFTPSQTGSDFSLFDPDQQGDWLWQQDDRYSLGTSTIDPQTGKASFTPAEQEGKWLTEQPDKYNLTDQQGGWIWEQGPDPSTAIINNQVPDAGWTDTVLDGQAYNPFNASISGAGLTLPASTWQGIDAAMSATPEALAAADTAAQAILDAGGSQAAAQAAYDAAVQEAASGVTLQQGLGAAGTLAGLYNLGANWDEMDGGQRIASGVGTLGSALATMGIPGAQALALPAIGAALFQAHQSDGFGGDGYQRAGIYPTNAAVDDNGVISFTYGRTDDQGWTAGDDFKVQGYTGGFTADDGPVFTFDPATGQFGQKDIYTRAGNSMLTDRPIQWVDEGDHGTYFYRWDDDQYRYSLDSLKNSLQTVIDQAPWGQQWSDAFVAKTGDWQQAPYSQGFLANDPAAFAVGVDGQSADVSAMRSAWGETNDLPQSFWYDDPNNLGDTTLTADNYRQFYDNPANGMMGQQLQYQAPEGYLQIGTANGQGDAPLLAYTGDQSEAISQELQRLQPVAEQAGLTPWQVYQMAQKTGGVPMIEGVTGFFNEMGLWQSYS